MTLYSVANYAMQTSAAPTPVTTGTSIKTMLQLQAPAHVGFRVVKWWVRVSSAPTAIVTCELVETGTVNATVTAHAATGIQPINDLTAVPTTSLPLVCATSGTGFTSSAEGTVTATRQGDVKILPIGVSDTEYEWSLSREWMVGVSKIMRIRMTTATAVSVLCGVTIEA